jgi:hypothetical protein
MYGVRRKSEREDPFFEDMIKDRSGNNAQLSSRDGEIYGHGRR